MSTQKKLWILIVLVALGAATSQSRCFGGKQLQDVNLANIETLIQNFRLGNKIPMSILDSWEDPKSNEYVPNEIIVKFRQQAADAVAEKLSKNVAVKDLSISASLDQLNKKHKIKQIKPVFRGFKAKRARLEKLMKKDVKTLTDKEKRIIKRLKRAPKNTKIPALDRIYKLTVELDKGQSLIDVVEKYNSDPDIEYAQVNHIHSLYTNPPEDPLYSIQWALNNTEQSYPPAGSGTDDCDIDAPEAWSINTGSSDVIVAVLDTGVDYTHKDLDENMWADVNGNCGYDFSNDDDDPIDYHGHGTHCAGIIGAIGDNNSDIAGVNWDVSIMAVKIFPNAYDDVIVAGIEYAADNGADVLSNSWGPTAPEPSNPTIEAAIDYAYALGCTIVFAAGNDSGADVADYSPANYSKTIAVVATDSDDKVADFSTIGDLADIAAPGVDILSLRGSGTAMGTIYDSNTTVASGTSMACPHVTGACALLLSENLILTPEEIRDILKRTADVIFDPNDHICASNGRLNLSEALLLAEPSRGAILLDNEYYSCSSVMSILLRDSDLEGEDTQDVTIEIDDGDSETVTLSETSTLGRFTGTITLSTGEPVPDNNQLEVAHGDIIVATYEDANNGTGNPASPNDTAVADCEGPVISNIQIHVPSSIATITFETDEPAIVSVLCDVECNEPYAIEESSSSFATSHVIRLRDIDPETEYFFVIEAEDVLGNMTVDNNDGQCYTFTTTAATDVCVPGQFSTIQEGIDNAWDGNTVWVADGTYTGVGNYDLNFDGKAITVSSENGPDNCVIDCQGKGRGFLFYNNEDANSVVNGFTIKNGQPDMTNNPNPRVPQDMERGAGIYCLNSSPTITNCKIVDNIATGIGGGIYSSSGNPVLDNCVISRNRGMQGGGICSIGDLKLTDCLISMNTAEHSGGGVYCSSGDIMISDCSITGNTTFGSYDYGGYRSYGGGICCGIADDIRITNCIVARNYAGKEGRGYGGGIFYWDCYVSVANCIIKNNYSTHSGGGMNGYNTTAKVVNCTIANNSTEKKGGGISCFYDTELFVNNSILWGNAIGENKEIYLNDNDILTIAYSDIGGGQSKIYVGDGCVLNWGEGNKDADPAFAFNDDYHLMSNSPCIDAGTNDPCGGLLETDLDGNPRSINGVADMGAYEYNSGALSIAVSPDFLQLSCEEGQAEPNQQTLSIRNCGGGVLSWEISKDCNWLEVDVNSGTSAGEIDTVTLSVDNNDLSAGDYKCELKVCDGNAVNSPRTVLVRLHVLGNLRVPEQYSTIKAAINAAWDGDTVLVADGTYTGNGNRDIEFYGKAITVKSENGPENCIIDCQGSDPDPHRGFTFYGFGFSEDANSVIDGFTVTGGYVNFDFLKIFPPADGGAISCIASNPMIENCIIKNNWALYDGGGIFIFWEETTSKPHIRNCIVTDNYADDEGGGIWSVWTRDWPVITDSIISKNQSRNYGGGIYLDNTYQMITNCTITNNSTGISGGGIYAKGGYNEASEGVEVTNCILWGNTAPEGPEITLIDGDSQDDFNSVLSICYSDVQGGQESLYVDPYSILIWGEDNIDEDPCFVDVYAGDFHLTLDSLCIDAGDPNGDCSNRVDIDGENRVVNDVVDIGADEFCRVKNITKNLYYIDIKDAVADPCATDGDVIVVSPGTYNGNSNRDIDFAGKAITVRSQDPNDPDVVQETIIDCQGMRNEPHRGFYLHNNEGPNSVISGLTIMNGYGDLQSGYYAGGAILCDGSNPTITNCFITNNAAYETDVVGGGIACYGVGADPKIINCIIANNSAAYGGGISCWDGSPVIENCEIYDNYAEDGAGVLFWNNQSTTEMKNCLIYGNNSGLGGGISIYDSAPSITNCTLTNNVAALGGGLWTDTEYSATLKNCLFWGNWDDEISHHESSVMPDISYCDIEGCGGSGANWDDDLGSDAGGNIDADPYFVNVDTNDFHLGPNSPCINAGDPNGDYSGQGDIDGDPRVMGETVDIGADEADCFPSDHPDYEQWVAVGKPPCWCYPRQCHGDADGKPYGLENYWVSMPDLTILKNAWRKQIEQMSGNEICADFDHAADANGFRVSDDDLDILIDYWSIPDGPDPNCFECN